MPEFQMIDPGRPQFFGGYLAGSVPAPNPVSSPLVFEEPGVYYRRLPAGVTTVTVEQWSPGGMGADGKGTATGGQGAGCGGYAKYSMGGALIVSGGRFLITVGAGQTNELATPENTHVVSPGSPTVGVLSTGGHAGSTGGGGGANTVTTGTGYSTIAEIGGSPGGAAAGKVGGIGQGSPNGGANASGGAAGKAGTPGNAPGGGGAGAGATPNTNHGGVGAAGKVVFTW